MRSTRRGFLKGSAGLATALPLLVADVPGVRFGVTDWNLKLGANPDAVPAAARLDFQGVQLSFGRKIADGKMPLDNPEIIARYLSLSKQFGIPLDATCVDRLHDNGLKSDPLAPKWVLDSIRLTRELKSTVLLVPFFGKWSIQTDSERDHVGDALRELAPEAEKAEVILGIENTISAEDNARILDRARSESVKIYYDVGNSTVAGFDPVTEIRWLGRERICQFHFKDNPGFMGEGKIQFAPILSAVRDIGYTGFVNLETDARPGNVDADLKRNLAYIREVAKAT